MPKSPPKEWWDEMYQEVKSGNPDYSEEQVRKTVGNIWYHKMSPAKKKKEVKKSEGSMRVEAINYTKNDKGEDVIAVGAPGSLARAKVEFPALIEELNALPDGTPIEEVTSRIKQADPTGGNMEQDSILQATKFYQAASLRVCASDRSEVVSGAANALWATAWADQMDELGLSNHLSGTEITEVMPSIPQEAHALAEKLIERIETTNAISFDTFVLPGFEEGEVFDGDNLGWYLAMESMGHGVAWTDNHAEDHGLKTPYFENYELSDVARTEIEKEYVDEIEEVASMTAKTAQQSFAFPNLFSSEAKRWIVTEVKRRAAEHAKTSASPEQTVAFIDKAADEVAIQLSSAVATEVESILDPDTKEKIYNEISVPQSDVGLPAAPQVGAPEEMAPVAASARVYMSPKLRIAFEKAADDFMQEQIEEGTWVQIDGKMGTEWIPADLVDLNEVNGLIKQLETGKQVDLTNTSLKDYSENKEAFYLEVIHGFGARLSAPGYMDKTDWTVFETKEQAAEHLKEMYGDEGIEEEGNVETEGERTSFL